MQVFQISDFQWKQSHCQMRLRPHFREKESRQIILIRSQNWHYAILCWLGHRWLAVQKEFGHEYDAEQDRVLEQWGLWCCELEEGQSGRPIQEWRKGNSVVWRIAGNCPVESGQRNQTQNATLCAVKELNPVCAIRNFGQQKW